MPIWILECSRDGGKTWRIEQPYRVFKKKETADRASDERKDWPRAKYRVTEYRPVEG